MKFAVSLLLFCLSLYITGATAANGCRKCMRDKMRECSSQKTPKECRKEVQTACKDICPRTRDCFDCVRETNRKCRQQGKTRLDCLKDTQTQCSASCPGGFLDCRICIVSNRQSCPTSQSYKVCMKDVTNTCKTECNGGGP